MNTQGHPLDLLLREAVGTPEPTQTEYLHGRRMLNAAIAAEANTSPDLSRLGSWLPRLAAVGASFVLVIAIGIGISLMRPQPVTALGELANIAEQVERPEASSGEYLYTRSAFTELHVIPGAEIGRPDLGDVAYLVPSNVETWVSDETRFVSRAMLQPRFFDPEAEAAYYAAGFDEVDEIGITSTETTAGTNQVIDERQWPTTPGALRQAMESYVSNEGSAAAVEVRIAELAASLLRETGASPELRATAIRVLEDLDVEVMERLNGDGVSVGIEYNDGIARMLVLEFDAESNLVREYERWLDDSNEFGIPAGTVVFEATYSPTVVTSRMPG